MKKENDFVFPNNLLEQLYELSGGSDKYKGFIFCACNPDGSPQIFTRFDSMVTSLGMKRALDQYLAEDDLNLSASASEEDDTE